MATSNKKLRKKKNIAQQVISDILDVGLADSDWKMKHPDAYAELKEYRKDMELDVLQNLGFSGEEVAKLGYTPRP